jgi:quercetin dioxygenase-like cupin family protein
VVHQVGTLAETPSSQGVYAGRADGYSRFPIVDRAAGSVHQTVAVAELAPGGRVHMHAHAYEEAIYVLEGDLVLSAAGKDEELAPDDFAFVPAAMAHALLNRSAEPARWYELGAPQRSDGFGDTTFLAELPAGTVVDVPFHRGHFDVGELPPPSDTLGLAGFGAATVGGASLKMLIEREAGASQFNLFVVEYVPGGLIKEHDHPFEESFFFVSGEIEAVLDGTTYTLRAGDYCWSGAASMHAFTNRSDAPVRWIETQVPQPPSRLQARFRADWEGPVTN